MTDNQRNDSQAPNPPATWHPLLGEWSELRSSLITLTDRMCLKEKGAWDEDPSPAICDALLPAIHPLRGVPGQCDLAPLPIKDESPMALTACTTQKHEPRKCMFHGMPRSG